MRRAVQSPHQALHRLVRGALSCPALVVLGALGVVSCAHSTEIIEPPGSAVTFGTSRWVGVVDAGEGWLVICQERARGWGRLRDRPAPSLVLDDGQVEAIDYLVGGSPGGDTSPTSSRATSWSATSSTAAR